MIQFSILACALILMCLFFILGTWVDSVYINYIIYTIYGYWLLKISRYLIDLYMQKNSKQFNIIKINEYVNNYKRSSNLKSN
jgi:hypothetical protein